MPRTLLVTFGLAGTLLVLAAPAAAERPFGARFSENHAGNIAVVGNTLMTCPSADLACGPAQQGDAVNNNSFAMEYVNVDADPTTFSSSSAQLALPAGARVLFAGLYYGGRTSAGAGGAPAPNAAARGTVRMQTPGAAGYEDVAAAADDSTRVGASYAAFADVTAQVGAAGAGVYSVANVQSGTGLDRYAGWALVVAYEHPSEPPRNLSVFDGLQTMTAGDPPAVIPVSGFRTPPTGLVRTNVGFVAYEGDRGATNDSATLNGVVLRDPQNPANNFFNSSISQLGVPIGARTPNFVNQLGFDADLLNANGLLTNGQTGTTLELRTAAGVADQYLAHAITFATELFALRVEVAKSVVNVTRSGEPARPGDVLRYTATFANTGGDTAMDVVATDPIPAGTEIVPGSLRITGGSNAPASPTDAPGDDLGEVAAGQVVLRVGSLPVDATAAVAFDVRVTAAAPAGGEISNVARADFRSQALGTALSAESPPAVIPVAPFVDLSVTKLLTPDDPIAGQQVTYTIVVRNNGPSDATAVTVADPLPEGFAAEAVRPTQGSCDRDGRQITCALGTLPAGGAAQVVVAANVARSRAGDRVSNEATATAAEFEASPRDNEDEGTARVRQPAPERRANLSVTKTADLREVGLGMPLTYTIRVRNDGPAAATGVEVVDTLGGPAEVVEVDPSQGRCRTGEAIRCELGRIGDGDGATILLRVRPQRPGTLSNGVSVAGARVDTARAANVDVVRVDVLSTASSARARVTKSASRSSVRAGQTVRYRIVLRSLGPDPARELSVCDRLPRALVLVRATGARVRGGRVCWSVRELADGARRSFELTVRATGAGPVTNTARVRGVNVRAATARETVRIAPRVTACPAAVRAYAAC